MHDQTLRLLNQGLTGAEIAEEIELPPALEQAWHTRGYYGSVSHNVKAIYQRYLGWFDGNPAHLWQHPPAEAARALRRVHGRRRRGARARPASPSTPATSAGWPRSLNHVVFAEPDNAGGAGAAGRHARAARLRRRERHLAQLLPHRRAASCAHGHVRHPRPARRRRTCSPSSSLEPALRRPRDPGRRAAGLGRAASASGGRSTATAASRAEELREVRRAEQGGVEVGA